MDIEETVKNAWSGNFTKEIQDVLKKHFDENKAAQLYDKTISELHHLIETITVNDEDKEDALFYILPSVAFYNTLKSSAPEKAYDIFREAYLIDGIDAHNWLKDKCLTEKDFARAFPQDFLKRVGGGGNDVVADTPDFIEFHVKKCCYVKLTELCGCPEICRVFCEIDNVMYEDINPHLKYNRDKTIYNGDGCCNFSFKYIENI